MNSKSKEQEEFLLLLGDKIKNTDIDNKKFEAFLK